MANSEGEGEPLIDLGAESREMQQEEWEVLSSIGTEVSRSEAEVGGIPRYFGKPIMQPPQFDGSTNWDDYLVQFELISELNGWSPDTKALYLAAGLKGQARAILSELDAVRRRDFKELVTALGRRFGAASQTQLYKAILRNRIRQTGESIPQLAQETKRLVMQAYPDAPFDMVETLAKDYFIDALGDADTRWRVYHSRPRMLADAVTVAVELDAFRTAEFKRGSLRRPVARVINAKYEKEKESKGDSDKEELLKQIRLLGENLNKTLTNTLIQLQEAMVVGRISEGPQCWEYGLLEPAENFAERHCMLVANALVDPREGKIPVYKMEWRDEDVEASREYRCPICKKKYSSGPELKEHLQRTYTKGKRPLEDTSKSASRKKRDVEKRSSKDTIHQQDQAGPSRQE
ncbi:hypothetical protein HOLleu_35392 [Holothuria leucospilota]|uniref:C2H2-type domain-containing protein n=1 Tax=Holothuria leucospilota TaxID=206669 RepID=A0A9Q0YMJ3_HOLLE|nr:hypothetical protein HOLleu_35392 [Holothuria leucospilota]